jgi:hypothetical protein
MDTKRITRETILMAIREIDRDGVPNARRGRRFELVFDGKRYPPKYVVSIAHRFATGRELGPDEHSGGSQTNELLRAFGFEVVARSRDLSPLTGEFGVREVRPPWPQLSTTAGIGSVPSHRGKPTVGHSESCSECKHRIQQMLMAIYGDAKREHSVGISTSLESYRGQSFFADLQRIWRVLTEYRGSVGFARNRSLQTCDIFVPAASFVLETDESQHFTRARLLALSAYPPTLPVGFDIAQWKAFCEQLNRHDPSPRDRDESRAWADTLRDFLPFIQPGMAPTVRVRMGPFAWCQLDAASESDVRHFRSLITRELPAPPRKVRLAESGYDSASAPASTPEGAHSNDGYSDAGASLDRERIRVEVFDCANAKIGRVILAGSLAESWNSIGSTENARVILRRIADFWPEDHRVDFLITFGGFLRFAWPFPTSSSLHAGTSIWATLVEHASHKAKECLDGVSTTLSAYTRYVTIGLDSRSVEKDLSMPHAELVGVFSVISNEEHWTGKTKPVPSQKVGLVRAPIASHFMTVGDQHVLVLGCHDLNLFSARAYANSSEERRTYLNSIRSMLAEWKPSAVLQHPHSTDSNRTWLGGWSGLKSLGAETLINAAGGVCYKGMHERPVRSDLASVLHATRIGPTLDFVVHLA